MGVDILNWSFDKSGKILIVETTGKFSCYNRSFKFLYSIEKDKSELFVMNSGFTQRGNLIIAKENELAFFDPESGRLIKKLTEISNIKIAGLLYGVTESGFLCFQKGNVFTLYDPDEERALFSYELPDGSVLNKVLKIRNSDVLCVCFYSKHPNQCKFIEMVNIKTLEKTGIYTAGAISELSLSPGGNFLAFNNCHFEIDIIDINLKEKIAEIRENRSILENFALIPHCFLSEDHFIYASGNRLKLYSLSDKKVVKEFKGHRSKRLKSVISLTGNTFLSMGGNNRILLWSVDKENPLKDVKPVEGI